jgi:hypothetical protein
VPVSDTDEGRPRFDLLPSLIQQLTLQHELSLEMWINTPPASTDTFFATDHFWHNAILRSQFEFPQPCYPNHCSSSSIISPSDRGTKKRAPLKFRSCFAQICESHHAVSKSGMNTREQKRSVHQQTTPFRFLRSAPLRHKNKPSVH